MQVQISKGRSDRDMLVIRMEAWAHENVIGRHLNYAQRVAQDSVDALDQYVKENPDGAGYWAGVVFNRFVMTMGAVQ